MEARSKLMCRSVFGIIVAIVLIAVSSWYLWSMDQMGMSNWGGKAKRSEIKFSVIWVEKHMFIYTRYVLIGYGGLLAGFIMLGLRSYHLMISCGNNTEQIEGLTKPVNCCGRSCNPC